MNSKTWFFGAIFGYGGQNSPWSPLGRATKFYMKEVAIIRNFHFKFEETPTIFVVTRRKKTFFLLKGPFLGAFRYPIIAPTSWFLYFLSLTSWSIPNIEFKLLWPILVPNFFRNHQKRTIFGMFPFYHVTSNSHISAIFCKYGMKFFGEPLEMLYQKNRIKKFGFHDHFILFLGQWTQKKDFFGAILGFWGQNSLWSRLGRATKFYMKEDAFIRNYHFKYEGIPTIFVVTMKKNLHFHCFRGPFWTRLSTSW